MLYSLGTIVIAVVLTAIPRAVRWSAWPLAGSPRGGRIIANSGVLAGTNDHGPSWLPSLPNTSDHLNRCMQVIVMPKCPLGPPDLFRPSAEG